MNILAHNLAEPAYDADVAQLEYKLIPGDHGLVIRLKGFNHKLPVSIWLGRSIANIFQVLIVLTGLTERFNQFFNSALHLGLCTEDYFYSVYRSASYIQSFHCYSSLLFCVFTAATESDCGLLGRLHCNS